MIINSTFCDMEKEAMQMLIKSDTANEDMLYKQYINASIVTRDFTGSGFFTHFSVPDTVRKIENLKKSPIGTVYGKISGLEIGVGFLLFLSNGVIDTLECYEYDSVNFPESITEYKLYYSADKLQ